MGFEDLRHKLIKEKHITYKLEYKYIAKKGLDISKDFLDFCGDHKWVRISLSRIHDDVMYLDKPYKITKDAIRAMIGLCTTRPLLVMKDITSWTINKLIGSRFDNKIMMVDDIKESGV